MLPSTITITAQDYLKALYQLQQRPGVGKAPIALGKLAQALSVTPGTVTTMVKRFADDGLISYTPRRGARLTPKGERAALAVLRRHRIVETFLVETLGLDWSEVHEEAEVLEHAISEKVLDRLDALLGRPSIDPHGDPIPDHAGRVIPQDVKALSQMAKGESGTIRRLRDQNAGFLDYAAEHGLRPDKKIKVLERSDAAHTLLVRVGRRSAISLSLEVASMIQIAR